MGQGFGGSIAGWMAYKRNLVLLPPISTASQNYSRYRIPRPGMPEPTDQDGLICWGVTGSLPSPQQLPTVGFQVVHNEEWNEWGRQTQDVRIENPDDPSQYIIDRRPTVVSFNRATQPSQAGSNTSAQVPPGIGDYPSTAKFIDGAAATKTQVKMNYAT